MSGSDIMKVEEDLFWMSVGSNFLVLDGVREEIIIFD